MADVYIVTVWKYIVCADILHLSKTWLATVHLHTTKAYLKSFKLCSIPRVISGILRLFFMSTSFRHYSGMIDKIYPGMIDQRCIAQIFFIIKTTCTFQCCLCTMFFRPANQTRFHYWNVIIWLVRSFEKPRCVRPEVLFLCFLCRGTSDPE